VVSEGGGTVGRGRRFEEPWFPFNQPAGAKKAPADSGLVRK